MLNVLNIFKQKKSDSSKREDNQISVLKRLIKQGETETHNQNFAEALRLFDQAIDVDPTYDCSYGDKALVLYMIHRFDESIDIYSKALELNSQNPITWYNKGLVFMRIQEIEKAIECFEKALYYDKGYSKAWYSKGKCFESQGEFKKAQDCLDQAKKLDFFLFTKIK